MESERGSSFLFDAFSSREPVPTSLENALAIRRVRLFKEISKNLSDYNVRGGLPALKPGCAGELLTAFCGGNYWPGA
jgi:hypothetical protein